VSLGVLSADGVQVFASGAQESGVRVPSRAGEYEASVTIPGDVLMPGEFRLSVCLRSDRGLLEIQEPALGFSVHSEPSVTFGRPHPWRGLVDVPCRWEIRRAP
jgi:hypothetical protein